MKLLYKAIIYYLLISLLFLFSGGIVIYLNTDELINDDIRNYLINREEIATTQIANRIPIEYLNNYEQTIFLTQDTSRLDMLEVTDTLIYDIIDDRMIPYAHLKITREIGKAFYEINIYKSRIESKFFITGIFWAVLYEFIGLLVVLIMFNLFISRIIWLPFYDTLNKIKTYRLGSSKKIKYRKTNTQEFTELNDLLQKMTSKMASDYNNLKEFTENASHEIQTPLTIINSKINRLMQSEKVSEEDFKHMQSIYNATARLSKLNKGLLLLTKIENRQYQIEQSVDIDQVIKRLLKAFEEMVSLKKLTLQTEITTLSYNMNRDLAQVLISNLLRNAIKYTSEAGVLKVIVSEGKVVFYNSGPPLKIDEKLIFERFTKTDKQSLGLGLSIVRKICDLYHIPLTYSYDGEFHKFQLIFKSELNSTFEV